MYLLMARLMYDDLPILVSEDLELLKSLGRKILEADAKDRYFEHFPEEFFEAAEVTSLNSYMPRIVCCVIYPLVSGRPQDAVWQEANDDD